MWKYNNTPAPSPVTWQFSTATTSRTSYSATRTYYATSSCQPSCYVHHASSALSSDQIAGICIGTSIGILILVMLNLVGRRRRKQSLQNVVIPLQERDEPRYNMLELELPDSPIFEGSIHQDPPPPYREENNSLQERNDVPPRPDNHDSV